MAGPIEYAGYGSGRLQAAQFLSEQKNKERDFGLREMQAYDQSAMVDQQIKSQELQNKQRQMEIVQAEELRKAQLREAALMSSAAQASVKTRAGESAVKASQALASTYKKLGSSLAASNPKRAKEFFDKALDIETKIPEVEKKQFDVIQARREERSNMMSEVTDQASWDVARAVSASMGLPIPATYAKFDNPETKKWMLDQNIFSKAGKAAMDAAIKLQKIEIDDKKADADIANKNSLIQTRDANELRKQQGLDKIPKEVKLDKLTARNERTYLEESSTAFDDLPKEVKGTVVQAVANTTQDILRRNPSMGTEEAKQMARDQILGQINNGVYTPAVSQKPTTPTDFNSKWASLKPGQTLVGPDGKTYTKR